MEKGRQENGDWEGKHQITVFKYVKGFNKERSDQLFSVSSEGRTSNNLLNLQQGRFRFMLDIGNNFLKIVML